MDKDPGGISRIENGKRLVGTLPAYHDLVRWAEVLHVPVAELAGEGPPPQVSESRAPYLTDEALLLRIGAEPVVDDDLTPEIEEFAASALHGRGNLIPQNYDDMRRPTRTRRKKAEPVIFKLRVSGNCMGDTVRDGEIVWFDTRLPREPVALVLAVRDEHESHIKRLVSRDGALCLESDDGWSERVDEHWRILAVAFSAQRRLLA